MAQVAGALKGGRKALGIEKWRVFEGGRRWVLLPTSEPISQHKYQWHVAQRDLRRHG